MVGRHRLQPAGKRGKGANRAEKERFKSRAFSRSVCAVVPGVFAWSGQAHHRSALGAPADEKTHKDTRTMEKYSVTKSTARPLRNKATFGAVALSGLSLRNLAKVRSNFTSKASPKAMFHDVLYRKATIHTTNNVVRASASNRNSTLVYQGAIVAKFATASGNEGGATRA